MNRILVGMVGIAISQLSWAHVEIGTYVGKTTEAADCSFEVKEVSFAGGVKHPLNERVSILVEEEEMTLSHPGLPDAESREIGFDHDHLNAVRGVAGGALAVSLTMEHSEEKDGPKEVWFLKDYKDNSKDMFWFCGELAFKKK